MDFEKSPKQLMDEAFELQKTLERRKYWSLNDKQREIVNKIAKDFPYTTELITGIYMEQKYSEEKTRKILSYRIIKKNHYSIIDEMWEDD